MSLFAITIYPKSLYWCDRIIIIQLFNRLSGIKATKVSKTDRNNRTTKFEYDKLDRLKNEQWKDAVNSTVRTLTYDYDAASRLTAAIDPDSRYTYSYDLADRLTQISNAGTAGVPIVSFTYGYDAANYLVSTQDTIAG